MLTHDLRIWIAVAVILAGVAALLLCLAAVDLASVLCKHLWLLASPRAARQARFRAVLAAYQGRAQKGMRRKP